MVRIIVLPDTHRVIAGSVVPDGDVLVHCGDWTAAGALSDYDDFFAWYSSLSHPYKLLVAGNHEKAMAEMGALVQARLPENITYLEDAAATIAGLRFWGSPRTPGYAWMAFTHRATDHPEHIWARIPDDTEVLVATLVRD